MAAYPNVWLNAKVDGSFGVTTPIFLDQLSPEGAVINTYSVQFGSYEHAGNQLSIEIPDSVELVAGWLNLTFWDM